MGTLFFEIFIFYFVASAKYICSAILNMVSLSIEAEIVKQILLSSSKIKRMLVSSSLGA